MQCGRSLPDACTSSRMARLTRRSSRMQACHAEAVRPCNLLATGSGGGMQEERMRIRVSCAAWVAVRRADGTWRDGAPNRPSKPSHCGWERVPLVLYCCETFVKVG